MQTFLGTPVEWCVMLWQTILIFILLSISLCAYVAKTVYYSTIYWRIIYINIINTSICTNIQYLYTRSTGPLFFPNSYNEFVVFTRPGRQFSGFLWVWGAQFWWWDLVVQSTKTRMGSTDWFRSLMVNIHISVDLCHFTYTVYIYSINIYIYTCIIPSLFFTVSP